MSLNHHKLFYKDPYLKTFETKILKQQQDKKGDFYITLEETAFYPTGGGQPHDTGTLNGVKVLNVEEVDGEIRHYVERALPHLDDQVVGVIDWERRFDHMQQHTGQHILSAAFAQLYDIHTVGFHLGNDTVTIDLDISELTEEMAGKAEKLANDIIMENRAIVTKWVEYDDLVNYPIRKLPSVKENIRLVIIDEFDYNGCGGTHPSATGEVGAIKVLNWERQRKKIRLSFVCGNRVITQFDQKQKVIVELTGLLNRPEGELSVSVKQLLENAKKLDKALQESNEKILQYEANELLAKSTIQNDTVMMIETFSDRSIQELQKLAKMIADREKRALIFFLSENDHRFQLVCGRGEANKMDMRTLMQESLSLIDGKGGGNKMFAQGGGTASLTKEAFMKNVMNMIATQIKSEFNRPL
ncbi:Alanine--tRNA ligase [Bacillus paralicheniformis]|uniref:Alanine--tRNA ligase n=1 Tax=Bacillus paralicheniformis TaxID=1648923 RepID=A0AAW6KFK7_9BACI|nr:MULTISPECIES: DHHA1 domain-containing protein [Bacillus]KUL17078.1 alanyl-tRNA synthetase [Bacillus licheniformis LMG 6934]MBG9883611.1 alanyl-tRNA synthetase [Bacillus paralicheniformis]MDE1381561.1 DHHA1 domain-containing protein [Bacillus paralicheniformis]MDE1392034.1 DHHA1 domain-containing protein [Bacillus paralicheniformis]MDE1453279.1 DHHA1 domain-containing protein [Bacillus paralicheniformis]